MIYYRTKKGRQVLLALLKQVVAAHSRWHNRHLMAEIERHRNYLGL